jgi:translation initiation factor 1
MTGGKRLVYSTDAGRVCAGCGWPEASCRCSQAAEEKVPARPVAKLRLETKGRGGKSVTVVDGLPKNEKFVSALCAELKKVCGSGGTARETAVEVQGDHRERLAKLLAARGFLVKGWPA